jgi:hypothetical protein
MVVSSSPVGRHDTQEATQKPAFSKKLWGLVLAWGSQKGIPWFL